MNNNSSPLVQLKNISKNFGWVNSLSNVSFDIQVGEIISLLGDNGAGKSTLIKTLAGVYPPNEGQFIWKGKAVKITNPRIAMSMGISVVYQDLAVVPMMSIYRNFFLGREHTCGRKIGGMIVLNKKTARKITQDALANVGIYIQDVDAPVSTLSGGERQSIAIARAIHFPSKLLIHDEPTAALSLKETDKVLNYVKQAGKQGVSVILITHNIGHAWKVTDRFVILYQGEVAEIAKSGEISFDELANTINTGKRTTE